MKNTDNQQKDLVEFLRESKADSSPNSSPVRLYGDEELLERVRKSSREAARQDCQGQKLQKLLV